MGGGRLNKDWILLEGSGGWESRTEVGEDNLRLLESDP